MKPFTTRHLGNRPSVWLAALVSILPFAPGAARAAELTITNGNSTVGVNTTSQAGMNSWIVDGQNVLNQQWFWFRIGTSGPQMSLDSLGAPTVVQTAGQLDLTYTSGSAFSIETIFTLSGNSPGSGSSGMGEQIKIDNLGGSPLNFYFFQYADFNLPGHVQLAKNFNNLFNEALVTSGNVQLSENIDTGAAPGANYGEAKLYGSTLNSLNNTPGYNLDGSMSAGSGTDHVTWGLEWNTNISSNGSFIISKVLSIQGVPEPPAWSLLSVGVLALGVVSRFRNRGK